MTGRAVAAAGVAGAVVLATSGVATAATGTTVTVKFVTTGGGFIKDAPPKKHVGPGDIYGVTEKLLQNNKQIGTDKMVGTYLDGRRVRVDGIFTFTSGRQGTLHMRGTFVWPEGNKPITVPIVGGTGGFAGEKGTITFAPYRGNYYVFHLG
jgi:hypothetical protein